MPAACRADVETLLRNKKLDRTLVSLTAKLSPGAVYQQIVKTGLSELDQQLGGGLPFGQMSEIVGPRSSGRTSLLMAILAAATARGDRVALVDTFDVFDPESAAGAGVDLTRMLWVRGEPCAPGFPHAARHAAADRVVVRALKAMNLILQAGGFGVIALDVADAPAQALRRVPMTTWMRFQRVIEGQEVVGLMLGSAPISRSAGGVSVSLSASGTRHCGEPSPPSPSGRAAGFGEAHGIWDSQRMFRGLESDMRTAQTRLVAGSDAAPVRLRVSA
jgi:hypothetical protein